MKLHPTAAPRRARKGQPGCWLLLAGLLAAAQARAQAPRLRDAHSLVWLRYAGDHQLGTNWTLHTEVQWRRADGLRHPQQELYRLGVAHPLGARLKAAGGYTLLMSHRYGPYAEVAGRAAPEHRAYEDLTLRDQLGRFALSQRARLEQRWLGTRPGNGEGPVQKWTYQNRIRYQLALTLPLRGPTLDDREWYLTGSEEVFISFGQNVQQNVFNQNRLTGGLGYQFTSRAQVELSYLYQIRTHAAPDRASNRPVVELNHGLQLNLAYSLDFKR